MACVSFDKTYIVVIHKIEQVLHIITVISVDTCCLVHKFHSNSCKLLLYRVYIICDVLCI